MSVRRGFVITQSENFDVTAITNSGPLAAGARIFTCHRGWAWWEPTQAPANPGVNNYAWGYNPLTTFAGAEAQNLASLPSGNLIVADNSGFPTTGTFQITTYDNGIQTVTYSGTDIDDITGAALLTGCVGGVGHLHVGAQITSQGSFDASLIDCHSKLGTANEYHIFLRVDGDIFPTGSPDSGAADWMVTGANPTQVVRTLDLDANIGSVEAIKPVPWDTNLLTVHMPRLIKGIVAKLNSACPADATHMVKDHIAGVAMGAIATKGTELNNGYTGTVTLSYETGGTLGTTLNIGDGPGKVLTINTPPADYAAGLDGPIILQIGASNPELVFGTWNHTTGQFTVTSRTKDAAWSTAYGWSGGAVAATWNSGTAVKMPVQSLVGNATLSSLNGGLFGNNTIDLPTITLSSAGTNASWPKNGPIVLIAPVAEGSEWIRGRVVASSANTTTVAIQKRAWFNATAAHVTTTAGWKFVNTNMYPLLNGINGWYDGLFVNTAAWQSLDLTAYNSHFTGLGLSTNTDKIRCLFRDAWRSMGDAYLGANGIPGPLLVIFAGGGVFSDGNGWDTGGFASTQTQIAAYLLPLYAAKKQLVCAEYHWQPTQMSNAANISPTPVTWTSGQTWKKFDLVLFSGNYYVAKADNSGVTNPPADTTNWLLLNVTAAADMTYWNATVIALGGQTGVQTAGSSGVNATFDGPNFLVSVEDAIADLGCMWFEMPGSRANAVYSGSAGTGLSGFPSYRGYKARNTADTTASAVMATQQARMSGLGIPAAGRRLV